MRKSMLIKILEHLLRVKRIARNVIGTNLRGFIECIHLSLMSKKQKKEPTDLIREVFMMFTGEV